MKDTFTIGDLAKNLGIHKETIRYYEQLGLLDSPSKANNGYRLYSDEDMRKLRFIRVVKSFGFTLKEIKKLFPKIYEDIHCENKEIMLEIIDHKLIEIDQKIDELSECKELLFRVSQSILTSDQTHCDGLDIYDPAISSIQ